MAQVTDRNDDSEAPLAPDTTAEVEIAAAVTVPEYPGNEGYPRDDLVVEAVYPFSGEATEPLTAQRRYAFPLSRIDRR